MGDLVVLWALSLWVAFLIGAVTMEKSMARTTNRIFRDAIIERRLRGVYPC